MSACPTQPAAVAAAKTAADLGLAIPSICLPQPGLDLHRWAVIACDQFTAQPGYWAETEQIAGHSPSALHLVLPEIYLEQPGSQPVPDRIKNINATMQQYLADGTLRELSPGWIAVDRATPGHPSRKGLVLAIDLEHYDFTPGNSQLIRATEGTVLDRIPPRLAIRRDAPLELPHVQLLIDDPGLTVIQPLFEAFQASQPVYETVLMQQGGSVRGWFIPGDSPAILQALQALSNLESLKKHGLLCAVGDGNHSLATAKAHWESLRSQVAPDHPARYALVEIVNIHDAGLDFEPIHRVVFNMAPEDFLAAAAAFFAGQDLAVRLTSKPAEPAGAVGAAGIDARPATLQVSAGTECQVIPLFCREKCWELQIGSPRSKLAAASLQDFLDDLSAQAAIRVDYIHGEDVVRQLAGQGALGLLLPALDKKEFFAIIAKDGLLPRKTFSMGEAREKRYYIECRRIR